MSSVLGFGDFFYSKNKIEIEHILTFLRKWISYKSETKQLKHNTNETTNRRRTEKS